MTPEVDVLIDPLTIRFSLWEGTPIYHMSGDPDTQLDGMELAMGVDPDEQEMLEMNLGFLPISSTTLIRGEKNIVVDPGNFHVGFYGLVEDSLARFDLTPADIDIVLITHSHFDHMGSTHLFTESTLVIGEGELDFARDLFWPEFIDAITTDRVAGVEYVDGDAGMVEIAEGVSVFPTPGHTPASISALVETESGDVAIIGDVAMTRSEFTDRELSHWYTDEQVAGIYESMDRIADLDPSLIIPGHDQAFRPR